MNTPHCHSVATEQTLALMLAVSRHTIAAHNSVAAGEWNRSGFGTELAEKRWGSNWAGVYRPISSPARQSIGMTIIAHDPYVAAETAAEMGIILLPLDHAGAGGRLSPCTASSSSETTNMINAAAIAQMKDGVIIVSVARGKLIDEQALADALHSGKVAAAAVDVYQNEPPVGGPC